VSKKPKLDVDDAYAVETPADNVRLYADWAETYDTDFVASQGYMYHVRVAEMMVRQKSLVNGAVLDVGCGTGIVGVCLREGAIEVVDGIEISPKMLAECGKKKTSDGIPAYRNLIQADLTKTLDIPGTLRVVGINSKHYKSIGFGEKLSADVVEGMITKPEFIEVNIYLAQTGDAEHAGDKALVVV